MKSETIYASEITIKIISFKMEAIISLLLTFKITLYKLLFYNYLKK